MGAGINFQEKELPANQGRPELLNQFVVDALSAIEEIESISATHEGGVHRFFVVLDQPDEAVLERIFDRELELRQALDDTRLELDVVFRLSRPRESILTAPVILQKTR